jgi:hypothetical protein
MPKGDDTLVVIFKHHANPNEAKSLEAGRLICDDMEVCEIRAPAARNTVSVHVATEVSHWDVDPQTGAQVKVTYAERFSKQYQQFKSHAAQTMTGTPLTHVPFLTEGRRAELRALSVYTVEALAWLDGQELKNIGQGGRELKNQAIEFIENAKHLVPNLQLVAELEAMKAKNMALEQDLEAARAVRVDDEFEQMSTEALRAYIAANTGQPPVGTVNRKTLLRMAMDARPESVA